MKVLKSFWFFMRPYMFMFFRQTGVALAEAAIRAVKIAASEYPGADSESKREVAFAEIKKDLKSQGIKASSSLINGAIEAAVSRMKHETASAVK